MIIRKIIPLIIAILVLAISGCATQLSVKHETGHLNLDYKVKTSNSEKTDLTLLMLPPIIDIGMGQTINAQVQKDLGMQYFNGGAYNAYSIAQQFDDNYLKPLRKNMQSSLNNIYSQKGFKEINVEGLDELTYPEKKDSFLAVRTKVTLNIYPKVTTSSCNSTQQYCTIRGQIQIGGKLNIQYIEPLTRQIIYNKKINLSNFNIVVPFKEQFVYKTANQRAGKFGLGDLVGLAMKAKESYSDSDSDSNSNKKITLTDNVDKSLTNALNQFYSKSLAKIDMMISQEQILSYTNLIAELKGKKAY